MSIQESWLDFKDKRFINFFYKPFVIYGKQFLKLLIFSLIVEFFFFGISRLIIFNVEVDYSLYTTLPFISIEVDFVSEFARAFFFILLILAIVFFIIRSTLITNTAKLVIEKGRANLVIVIENTVKKIKEILIFTLLIVTILIFPFLMITLAILMMMRNHYLAWSMILFAIIVPYFFLPKFSLYTAGMAKDNLHVGSALQQSWYLTDRKNWSKSSIFFVLFSFISIIGPWLLTIYMNQRHSYIYLGLIMTLIRGFLFPLYDSAMTYNYYHFNHSTIEESVFKEDIMKQEARSEKFVSKVREKRVKDI